jgi:ADP-ribosyl-[dinitrogen reductase] hydrolase
MGFNEIGIALNAVNRRFDADTVGAVAEQIAGAIYGYKSIPTRWLNKLFWYDDIVAKAKDLFLLNS